MEGHGEKQCKVIGKTLFILAGVAMFGTFSFADKARSENLGGEEMNMTEFTTQAFRCVIGNNAAGAGGHNAIFNGIWSLIPRGLEESFVADGLAGLNLEHYFNGWDEDPKKEEILFEPRYSPMEFQQGADSVCTLYQPATKFFGVESWTEFTVTKPHYLDMIFRCIPRKDVFHFGWLGVFWATYVENPEEKSIFFLAYETPEQKEPKWYKSAGGMYYSRQAQVPLRFEGPMQGHAMSMTAPVRWAEPFYYGVWRGYAYIVMFDTEHDIGIYAGHNPKGWNPWDFQMIIHHPKVGSEYRLRVRIVFDKFKGQDWVLDEYKKWKNEKR